MLKNNAKVLACPCPLKQKITTRFVHPTLRDRHVFSVPEMLCKRNRGLIFSLAKILRFISLDILLKRTWSDVLTFISKVEPDECQRSQKALQPTQSARLISTWGTLCCFACTSWRSCHFKDWDRHLLREILASNRTECVPNVPFIKV